MYEGLIILIFIVIIILQLIGVYIYNNRNKKHKEEKTTIFNNIVDTFPSNREQIQIKNENEFINIIVNKYDTYEEFLTSLDFDDYFTYWNSHPEVLNTIKNKIEKKRNTTFNYKKINY